MFNRTPQRFYDLQASLSPSDQPKIILADSAEAAVKDADIIFTSFGDDQSVLDMYGKLLAGCSGTGQSKIFVETSTVSPETAKHIAKRVEQLGETYVAMPSECLTSGNFFFPCCLLLPSSLWSSSDGQGWFCSCSTGRSSNCSGPAQALHGWRVSFA